MLSCLIVSKRECSQEGRDGLLDRELTAARRTPYRLHALDDANAGLEEALLSVLARQADGEPVEEAVNLVALAMGAVERAKGALTASGGVVVGGGWGVVGEAG